MVRDATDANLAEAAAVLVAGGLVAFPTETVYGLGARADRGEAVRAIYAAKGRPAENPSIVHVASAEQAFALAAEVPSVARALADAVWPGPLTMVLRVRPGAVAPEVTAFGETVGLRVPRHPVAQALLARAGVPVAAPSANRSNQLSPTTAQHVVKSFGSEARSIYVLDGGATGVGLESTIVDLSGDRPVVLRRGSLTASELGALLSLPEGALADRGDEVQAHGERLHAPGRSERHYAPRVPLLVMAANDFASLPRDSVARAGVVLVAGGASAEGAARAITLPRDPGAYARDLYASLHALEDAGIDAIYVERPPSGEGWAAIHDRLARASTRPG